MIGRRAAVLLALAGVLAAAAGCGGGGSAESPSSSPSGPTGSTSVDALAPIMIGSIGTFTGPHASSDTGAITALNAWVASTNANGGLLGHKVDLVVKDDGGSAETAGQAVRDLVEKDRVVAIVSDQSDVDSSWQNYVDGKKVPVIGGTSENVPFLTDANFFASGANLIALTYGVQVIAKTRGTNLGSLYCADVSRCAAADRAQNALGVTTGVKVAVEAELAIPLTDPTAVCQRLLSANVLSYTVTAPPAIASAVATACAAQGVTAAQIGTGTAAAQDLAATPALQGSTYLLPTAPWFVTSIPGVAVYRQALSRYVPAGLGALDGPNAFSAWIAGQLFAKAVVASGSPVVTADSVRAGLYALRGETLGGIVAPITYRRDRPNLLNCYFGISIVGGALTAANSAQPTCAPDAVVAAAVDKVR